MSAATDKDNSLSRIFLSKKEQNLLNLMYSVNIVLAFSATRTNQ